MKQAITLGIAMTLMSCGGSCRHEVAPALAVQPAPPSEAAPLLAARLEVLRKGGRRDVSYRPPMPDEERAYSAWVQAVARAAIAGETPAVTPPPGFALERIVDVWLLSETPDMRRGAGAIALRIGRAAPVLVQAPHTFFDMGTLPVALDAFDGGRCRALLINTVHRYASGRGEAGGTDGDEDANDAVSDVAHAPASFFLAGHRALLAAEAGAWTVQLHGFADDRAPGVDVILSASVTTAPLGPVAARARAVLGDSVRLYPDEIRVLGALKNVEASASRAAGAPFLHVEMSRALRDRLGSDEALRRRAASAFVPVSAP
jgi:hypothetical protein